jgi:hypothetical protein
MHYIPFFNEDKKNTCEKVNCKNCPLFKTELIDNTCYMAYCNYTDYTEGDIIYYDQESDIITLSGRSICPVKYKDPVEKFHYLHITSNIMIELANTCEKLQCKNYKSDEEKESLEKRKDDIWTCLDILKKLFPEKDEIRLKLLTEDGYNLDDDMNLYKV